MSRIQHRTTSATVGTSLMLSAAFSFAVAGALCVYAKGSMSAWQLVSVRCVVFLSLLSLWAARHPREAKGNDRPGLVLRGLAGTSMPLLQFYAFFELPAAVAMTLARSVPLWVVIVAFFWKGWRPSARELLAISVAIVGVALVYQPERTNAVGSDYTLGVIAGLGCSLSQAIAFIKMRDLRRTDSVRAINLWLALVGLCVSLPVSMMQSWTTTPFVWGIAITVGASMFLGQISQTRALQSLRAPIASTLSLVASVVFAAILGYALFNQRLSHREVAGLVTVILGGALAAFAARAPESGASD